MTPQPEPTDRAEVTKLAAAVEEALAEALPTSYRDNSPLPAYGPTPPVPQPGARRPPMSQRATDASALMLSAGVASLPIGGMTSLVLYTLGHTDPVSLAIGAGAPASLAIPILALARLVRRAGEAAPAEIHQTYTGPVHQETRITHTRAVWSKNVKNH